MEEIKAAAQALVAQMTPEEKASLCSGADFWELKGVPRLGLAGVCITDGPHGLRKQTAPAAHGPGVNLAQSVPTTCFPAACATACSFDPALLEEMGEAMAEECLAEEVAVILGPGTNMKRSALCGRNFEYFSEDPLLAGKCAAGLIRGVERKNVGTSLKHFAGNNQEALRMVGDSRIDERALREIYLSAFETAITESRPATVMCSYNRLNGVYASDSRRLLTDILRKEWGFDGLVMTDWGAMNDRVNALDAGLDLQMPGPCTGEDAQILRAVREGLLPAQALDDAATRVTALLLRGAQNVKTPYDVGAHHVLAGKIAEQSAVLLQNDGVLPFKKTAKVLVVGGFAETPRYQGAGSSQIVPTMLTSALDAFAMAGVAHTYMEGFAPEETRPNSEKTAHAVAAAQDCEAICVFAGLPASYESEGFDRDHMQLPESQIALIRTLSTVGVPLVVVLSCGSSVEVPFTDCANAILLMNLSGQNSGTAVQRLLYGDANPCGKLAETWPLRLADTGNLAFFGARQVQYRESIYIGYRWYDKAQLNVRWPFGHGLSYSSFAYSDLRLSAQAFNAERSATLTVTFTLKNIGKVCGSEIAQVYVSAPQDALFMPLRELRGFAKVELTPGESKTVRIQLSKRAFAYYNVPAACWHVQNGTYHIEVGPSSRGLPLCAQVDVTGDANITVPDMRVVARAYYAPVPGAFAGDEGKAAFEALLGETLPPPAPLTPYTKNSAARDLSATRLGRFVLKIVRKKSASLLSAGVGGAGAGTSANLDKMMDGMLLDMPLRSVSMLSHGKLTPGKLDGLVAILNGHPLRGVVALLKK